MSAPTPPCVHDWQPITGWYARYRCSVCRVIGYKPGAVRPQRGALMTITAYRCEARCGGERCPEPAVRATRGAKFRCAVHGASRRTMAARGALAGERETGAAAEGGSEAEPAGTARQRS